MKRIGTQQRKTRYKFRRHYRQKGKIALSHYFQELKDGDLVCLKINSNLQTGRFFPRYHGAMGHISGKRGECYQVTMNDGNKEKKFFVHPYHLVKQKANKN